MWPFNSRYRLYDPQEVHEKSFHYIVVGGGTAGCVLASRLSEDPGKTVLLLERGPLVDNWSSHVPLLSVDFRSASSPTYRWKSADNKVSDEIPIANMVSGRALGGTSKVNAHIYTRSVPGDYNALKTINGCMNWGWENVESYFKKSENSFTHGSMSHRGSSGPWHNRQLPEVPFTHTNEILAAAESLGIPRQNDIHEPSALPYACGIIDHTINSHGKRVSTFDAFLPSEILAKRPNLFICPETVVAKLEVESDEAGARATGVHIYSDARSGSMTLQKVTATSEVILCGGAIATPQILMLSGIGPAEHMRSLDIPVVRDLPGVGSNLQDHPCVPLIYKVPSTDSLHEIEKNPTAAVWELLRYVFLGKGLLLSPNPQMIIYALSRLLDKDSRTQADSEDHDSHSPSNVPDIELTAVPYNVFDDSELATGDGVTTLTCILLKPRSSGTVRLSSLDARDRPICDLAYMQNPADYEVLRKALRLGLAIGRKCREQGYPLRDYILPDSESDADLDKYIRRRIRTTFHYASTCRMAPVAEGGVVDDQLRVHGVRGLRIADASIFPNIPSAHPQAPVVMVAERCADFIKAAGLR